MSNFLDDLLDESKANAWIQQGTPEWDQVRLGRFTSSEISRLMEPSTRDMTDDELKARPKSGKGSRTTKVEDYTKLSDGGMTYVKEKVAEIMTGQARVQGYAFPLVYGKDMEPVAAEHFEKVKGVDLQECGFFTYTNHAGGSPDRLVGDNAILEIKCPADSVNMLGHLMLTDHYDVRRDYFQYWAQCQANMLFTGRNLCHFVAFDPRMLEEKHKMAHIELPADVEFHNFIIGRIEVAVKEKLSLLKTLS